MCSSLLDGDGWDCASSCIGPTLLDGKCGEGRKSLIDVEDEVSGVASDGIATSISFEEVSNPEGRITACSCIRTWANPNIVGELSW